LIVHEWSIVESLLAEVEREAARRDARAVHRIHVRIGALAGVEIPLLTAAYETFRARTRCERAELRVESVPARWSCPRCGREPAPGEMLRCRDCGVPARLDAGDEIVLERIELEVP
jgi:hydrogenase nickel incorporation protein HypA/HybF